MTMILRYFLLRYFPLAVLLLLLPAVRVAAQTPTWQSAMALVQGVNGYSQVKAATADAAGNVYLVGTFSGTASFGGVSLGSTSGSNDVFVAKWNSSAGFVWAQRAGGSGTDEATSVAVSGPNVYIAGSFSSATASFGGSSVATAGNYDAFVAKLVDAGSTGSFVWAQSAGGTGNDAADAVAVSGASVYVAGYFASPTAGFGGMTLTSAGSDDGFVAKLTDTGTAAVFGWTQQVSGPRTERAHALAVNGASVYVAGGFANGATIGGLLLSSTGNVDVFVAKLADAGSTSSVVWVRLAGGASDDEAIALALSGGNVYLAGYFGSGTARFGSVVLSNTDSGAATPSRDVFVAKLTDAGQTADFTWAYRAGGTSFDYAFALVVAGSNVYVSGYYSSITATFGGITLVRSGFEDLFVAKLIDAGPSGAFAWVARAGGPRTAVAAALALQGSTVHVGGHFSQSATFAPLTIVSTGTGYNAYWASLTDPTLTAVTPAPALAAVTVFPNPAHATATVQLPPVFGMTTATLTLLDALGRVVRVQIATTTVDTALDLRSLPAGLYALRITAGTHTATCRLVVE